MEKTIDKTNSRDKFSGETLRVANGQETAVVIPIVVKVVQVQVPLGIVLVEVRHVAVTVNHSRRNMSDAFRITAH